MRELKNLITRANRLLFVGVGNVLKSDDGVGVMISRQIVNRSNIFAITVEVSIENYIGKINSMQPEEIVILDCMDLGASPGTCRLLAIGEVEDLTFNTHNISLGRLRDFFPFPAFVLGIQPQTVAFGDALSAPVQKRANLIIRQINAP
ncbi:MAG: hydrogenase maturation protease [Bacteroidota bacterium]